MRYMLLINGDPNIAPQPGTAEAEADMARYNNFTKEVIQAGVFAAGDPLHPASSATTVRERNGRLSTTDGPFAETKEVLAGYYILNCLDLDEALAWAKKIPAVAYGSVEIRPVADMGMPT